MFFSITPAEMAPFTEQLLNNLFKALALPGSAENEYIMKGKPDFFFCHLKCFPLLFPSRCQTNAKVILSSLIMSFLIFKAIMRSFSLLQEAIVPYIPTLIGQLTHKLLLVSKVTYTLLLFMYIDRFTKMLVCSGDTRVNYFKICHPFPESQQASL